jgi:putative hydrolase of the HAD superfamily
MTALVLDFGGPVLLTPFELTGPAERRAGLPHGSLDWTGPLDPGRDEMWRALQAQQTSEPEYWQARARELQVLREAAGTLGEALGSGDPVKDMMALIFAGPEHEIVRPEAYSALRFAQSRGVPVAVLTNDLILFHDEEWIERIGFLHEIDALVDATRHGVRKPDAAAYELVAGMLGVPLRECVLVDDQSVNLDGATSVGMAAVWFDVTDPDGSYAAVYELLDRDGH